jgi:hypothetical protein
MLTIDWGILIVTRAIITSPPLCNPEPDFLSPVPGKAFRPLDSIQRSLAGMDVRLGGIAPVGALEDLPEEEETEVDGDLILNVSKDVSRM